MSESEPEVTVDFECEFPKTPVEEWHEEFEDFLDTLRDYFNRQDLTLYLEEMISFIRAQRSLIEVSVVFDVIGQLEAYDTEDVVFNIAGTYEGLREKYILLVRELFLSCKICETLLDGNAIARRIAPAMEDGTAQRNPEGEIVKPVMEDFDNLVKHLLEHVEEFS